MKILVLFLLTLSANITFADKTPNLKSVIEFVENELPRSPQYLSQCIISQSCELSENKKFYKCTIKIQKFNSNLQINKTLAFGLELPLLEHTADQPYFELSPNTDIRYELDSNELNVSQQISSPDHNPQAKTLTINASKKESTQKYFELKIQTEESKFITNLDYKIYQQEGSSSNTAGSITCKMTAAN